MENAIIVPRPFRLEIWSEPRAMRALSFMAVNPRLFLATLPDMACFKLNPRPLSRMVKDTLPSSRATFTETRLALACLTTLVKDS